MMPEKLGRDFMTAQAPYAPIECVDSRTGQAFAPTEDQSENQIRLISGRVASVGGVPGGGWGIWGWLK
jgi:hypothetical protein